MGVENLSRCAEMSKKKEGDEESSQPPLPYYPLPHVPAPRPFRKQSRAREIKGLNESWRNLVGDVRALEESNTRLQDRERGGVLDGQEKDRSSVLLVPASS